MLNQDEIHPVIFISSTVYLCCPSIRLGICCGVDIGRGFCFFEQSDRVVV